MFRHCVAYQHMVNLNDGYNIILFCLHLYNESWALMSFIARGKIIIDLQYVTLDGYCWNLPGDILIYKGSLVHSYPSFEILSVLL